ncbi:MAG: hypothetical protein AAB263_18850 [Planctomycetota bacterium]
MAPRLRTLGITASVTCATLAIVAFAAEVTGDPRQPAPQTSPAKHAVQLRAHTEPPRVLTGVTDQSGRPATIACGTCHATRKPDAEIRTLTVFHQDLKFVHGNSSCLSCHDSSDYDRLHLADGRKVAFVDSLQLCSQCHGPQRRDWDKGAHGGMNGYWDLSKGGRVRNTCIQCHDPHVPKYQGVIPMPPPRDRFMNQSSQGGHHE